MNKDYLNLSIQVISIIVAFAVGKYSTKQEKQITSRKLFENCYQKVFSLIEKDFYNEELSLLELKDYSLKITDIFKYTDGYYYHSLEEYCNRILKTNNLEDANENWLAFCWSFDRQLIKTEKEIGLPIRSFTYRVSVNQYSSLWQIVASFFRSFPLSIIFLVILLALYIFLFLAR
jgi:hypothetical protein